MKPKPAEEDVGMMRAMDESRKGSWMECFSGTRFYCLDPRPEDVLVVDIAHHLARINRYNGAIHLEQYSVAEHSVAMATWFMREHKDPLLAYQALMHDAPEAYIGDMVRPLKRELPAFVEAEEPVWRAVVDAFPVLRLQGLKQGFGFYELDARVKEADNRILVDERAQVMNPSYNTWGIDHLEPLGVELKGLRPVEAELAFLQMEATLRAMVVAHG